MASPIEVVEGLGYIFCVTNKLCINTTSLNYFSTGSVSDEYDRIRDNTIQY